MDDLILAALQERISALDAARLDAWRRTAPANEERFRELSRLWRMSAGNDPMLASTSMPPPALVEKLRSSPSIRPEHQRARGLALRRPGWLIPVLAAAAGVAATLVAVALQQRAQPATPATAPALGAAEFVTDSSETATARLADGSVVRLAPRSRLRVTPGAERREVWLDGEGFFAIARDPARPFRVRTRVGSVEVLGTRFDARVEGSNLRIVVTEGEVAVMAAGRRVPVVAGELAIVTDEGVAAVSAMPDPSVVLEWMRDALIFQDTPLRDVARELEGRYGIRVLLPDSAVAERRVTAWFTNQDVSQVLAAVCRAVDAHCTLAKGVASIEP